MPLYGAVYSVVPLPTSSCRSTPLHDVRVSVPDFEPVAGQYLYKQVAGHLRLRIEAGELRAGAKLPGERELAAEYGVAIGTARRAVQDLRDRGLVQTLPSLGTFIAGKQG
jgi:DNA-binding GntR family transcriptional regulator